MRRTDVIIIGGGAAGLAAAIAAARSGAAVTVLEHTDRVGRKLLATGNGRCNFTNADMRADYFRGSGQALAAALLHRFGTEEILAFFTSLGIEPWERNGYYYPSSGQAASVLEVLRLECARLRVEMLTEANAEEMDGEAGAFTVTYRRNGKKRQLAGSALILATGSMAAPVTGSDGSGYDWAKRFGHHIRPVYPALTGLRTDGDFLRDWSGVRVRGSAALSIDEKTAAADAGELQLTDYGVSGIPVFQISRYAAEALAQNRRAELALCFWPKRYCAAPEDRLRERFWHLQDRTLRQAMIGLLPAKLIPVLIRRSGLSPEQSCLLSDAALAALASSGSAFRLRVIGTGNFAQAQVCAGGVDGSEINPRTMESLRCRGLYLAGELIDVDGVCGGYNLHFAFASGLAAGESAAKNRGGQI